MHTIMPYEFVRISRVVVLPALSFVSSDKDGFVVTALQNAGLKMLTGCANFSNKNYTPQTLHLQKWIPSKKDGCAVKYSVDFISFSTPIQKVYYRNIKYSTNNSSTNLLFGQLKFEAIKISQSSSLLPCSKLLGPCGLFPLF